MKVYIKIIFFFLFINLIKSECDNYITGHIDLGVFKKCIKTLELTQERQENTIEMIKFNYNNIYIFRDISSDSGPPFNITSGDEIAEKLNEFKEKEYTYDFDFHNDIQKLFVKLRDKHTFYMIPKCYCVFVRLPFSIYGKFSYVNPNQLEIYLTKKGISKDILRAYETYFNDINLDWNKYNMSTLNDTKILTINGVDAFDYLKQYADENIRVRDEGIRLNLAIKEFSERFLASMSIPDNNFIELEISIPNIGIQTLKIDYLVSGNPLGLYNNLEDLCYPDISRRKIQKKDININNFGFFDSTLKELKKENDVFYNDKNSNYRRVIYDKEGFIEQKFKDSSYSIDIRFFIHDERNDTVILQVSTFHPTELDIFIERLNYVWKHMNENNMDKLIIDLRGNGYLFLSRFLLNMISTKTPTKFFDVSDAKLTDIFKRLQCDLKKNKNLVDLDGNLYRHKSKLYKATSFTRGGKTSEYSAEFGFDDTYFLDFLINALGFERSQFENKIDISPNNLVIISDGDCSSSCGNFISYIETLKIGKILSIGGIPGKFSNAVSNVRGSIVTTNEMFLQGLSDPYDGCNLKEIYFDYTESGVFSFSQYEKYIFPNPQSIYDPSLIERNVVREFTRDYGDLHLNSWQFYEEEHYLAWDKAFQMFEACFNWWINPDPTCPKIDPHGIYGKRCNNPHGHCELAYCEKGYYVDIHQKECIKEPEKEKFPYLSFLADQRFQIVVTILIIVSIVIIIPIVCLVVIIILFMIFITNQKMKNEKFSKIEDNKEIEEVEEITKI